MLFDIFVISGGTAPMPRKPRVEYAGAVYHVMDRGDRLETVFRDDGDRELFLKTLGQACDRTGWRVHSYVLMGNHYHMLLETPERTFRPGCSGCSPPTPSGTT